VRRLDEAETFDRNMESRKIRKKDAGKGRWFHFLFHHLSVIPFSGVSAELQVVNWRE
jgi:hypothetical protein